MHWSEIAALFSCGGVVILVIRWFANGFVETKLQQRANDINEENAKNNRELRKLFDRLEETLTKMNIAFDYIKEDVQNNTEKVKENSEKIIKLETKVQNHENQLNRKG